MKLLSKSYKVSIFLAVSIFLSFGLYTLASVGTAQADSLISRYFPETGHTLSGKFLAYWNANGGLPVFGYPLTDAHTEVDPETGKSFLTQWFERNRFELHTELAGTKYEVELGLLGKDLNRNRLNTDPNFQPTTAKQGFYFFPQTKHNVGELFYRYWQQNGDLALFGYPISEPHTEVDPETGLSYTMQWFERARFEYHPDNTAPYNVLLGLLGRQIKLLTPATLIQHYYNAINRQDYRQAYNYWEQPSTSLAPYDQFVQGYADTTSVALSTGTVSEDAGAGNIYASVPVVLQATHTNGSHQTFYGCYIVHRVNIEPDQPWGIRSATIQIDSSGADVQTLLNMATSLCEG
jgi:hypothetical protein